MEAKTMLPCYYVVKIDEVKECAEQTFTLKQKQKNIFKKLIGVTTSNIVGILHRILNIRRFYYGS